MADKKSTGSAPDSLKKGDEVTWGTPQGKTEGTVIKKITGTAHVDGAHGGHTAKASSDEPQFEVASSKTGKKAIHKPGSLHKK